MLRFPSRFPWGSSVSRSALLVLLATSACAPDVSIAVKDPDEPEPADTDPGLPIGQPDIAVEPLDVRFGGEVPGCVAPPRTVTVRNEGEVDLEVAGVALRGADRRAYTLDVVPFTVPPGGSETFEIGFEPPDLGPWGEAVVEIASNDPDESGVKVDLDGQGSEFAQREDLFVQGEAGSVDVLFSIDYSGSMSEEIAALGSRFDAFIQNFVNLGLDYRIAVVTADPACPGFQGDPKIITPQNAPTPADAQALFRAATGVASCSGEAAFGATRNALSPPWVNGENAGFLRADATLAVVALSDEPEQSGIRPADYVSWLEGLKTDPRMVSFSGIVGPPTGGVFVCGGEVEPAPQYHAAIRQSGGVWGNMCNLDLVPFLLHLSYVAAGLEFGFELSEAPLSASPAVVTVTVDGVAIPYSAIDGWTYDSSTNAVQFHGSAIPEPGQTVLVTYPYDSGCEAP